MASALPTYESVRYQHPIAPSLDFLRLRWRLKGSIEASIAVIDDATDASSTERPYQTIVGQVHAISSSSMINPRFRHHRDHW